MAKKKATKKQAPSKVEAPVISDDMDEVEFIQYYREHWDQYIEDVFQLKVWSGMRYVCEQVRNNQRTSIRASHGISKCRDKDERIQLSSGEIVRFAELIDKTFEIETPEGFMDAYGFDNGIKPIKIVELGNGTVIKITKNHPLYVAKKTNKRNKYRDKKLEYLNIIGFTDDIKEGDCIAVPVKTNIKTFINIPEIELKLLGYVIGDGCVRHKGVMISTGDEIKIDDIYKIAEYYGSGVKLNGKYDYKFTNGNIGPKENPITKVIRKYGFMEHLAKDKFIPADIFKQDDNHVCLFLKYLYMCDGHVVYKENKNRTITQIVYTTVSKQLIDDLYILLKRIGIKRPIISKQKTQWVYKGIKKHGECYKIIISSLDDCLIFSDKITLWGYKGQQQRKLIKTVRRGAKRPYGKWRSDCLEGMYWEDVKKITISTSETVGITVPNNGTYLTPYAYEHNTLTSAAIAVTFLNLYFPSIVITTAPTGNQVKNLLWKEIGDIYAKQGSFLNGKADMQQVRIAPDWYMIGFSTDRQFRMEGFHGSNILWILDEAKGLPQWVYDAVEGSLTGGFARLLEISTTDGADQQCPLRIHHNSERSKWGCTRFSAFDSPFVDQSEFLEYKKYMNPILYKYGKPKTGTEWPMELSTKIQITTGAYIRDHEDWKIKRKDLWETKICGDFSTMAEDNIIPLAWIESAINAEVDNENPTRKYGFDVARMGTDKSILTPVEGKVVLEQISWGKKKTMESVGMVMNIVGESDLVQVDACGIGAGVFDRLAELGQPVIGLDSAASPFEKRTYVNLKAEMWFAARALFEKQYEEGNTLSIPNDPELIEDLSGMKYIIRSDGKIITESKERYKKRLGRSPDKGDSLIYGLYEVPEMDGMVYEGEIGIESGEEIFL